MTRIPTNNARGFTLLEVIIAIAVFSVATLGVLGLLLTNIRGVLEVENRLVAINLAQGKLDALLDVRNNNWVAGEPFMTGIQTTEKTAFCQDNRGFYVEDIDNNPQCRTTTRFMVRVIVGDCEDIDNNGTHDVCPVTTRVYWADTYAELSMRFYDWGKVTPPEPAPAPEPSTTP